MIPYINDAIFILGMCVRIFKRILTFLCIIAPIAVFFGGCDGMDTLLPSAGTYKINVQINGVPLDECSYARQSDKINPFFVEPVSRDPDVTALMVFLRDSKHEITGWKVLFNIDSAAAEKAKAASKNKSKGSNGDNKDSGDEESAEAAKTEEEQINGVVIPANYKNGDELIIPVSNLDNDMPFFPMPRDLRVGVYTMVSQVMSGKDVLQRTEKTFYYLGNTVFSYKGISAYLPGIADSPHFIPKGTVVLLEADLEYDKKLDPYVIWYDGKNIISEGSFSDGKGQIFWEAPEQSGFFVLRAEIFPNNNFDELAGFTKEISLLVSSKEAGLHLISNNIAELVNWYKFESDLKDAKMPAAEERDIKQTAGKKTIWMGENRTYGLAAGYNNLFSLPKTTIQGSENDWQILFRLNSINNGGVFSVLFGSNANVRMHFYIEGSNLILVLTSPLKTVSQTISLSPSASNNEEAAEDEQEVINDFSFFTAGVRFSVLPGMLRAQINIAGNHINKETAPIVLAAEIKNEFQIILGFTKDSLAVQQKYTADENESPAEQIKEEQVTAIWDEFALYHTPPMDIIAEEIKPGFNKEKPAAEAES